MLFIIPKIIKLHIANNVDNNILTKISKIVSSCHINYADVIGADNINIDIINALSDCKMIRYNILSDNLTDIQLPDNVDLCVNMTNSNIEIPYIDNIINNVSFKFSCITADERQAYLNNIENITGIKPILTFETDDVKRYFYEWKQCRILATQCKYIDNNQIYSAKYTDEGKTLNIFPSENRCPYFLSNSIVLDTNGNFYYCEASDSTFDNINNYDDHDINIDTIKSIYYKQKDMWEYNRTHKDVLIDRCPNCIYRTIMTEQVVESLTTTTDKI